MAITINSKILGQTKSQTAAYSYLYEPLRIVVTESDLTATKLFMNIELIETSDNTVVETLVKYVEFDINSGVDLSIDLMKIIRQHNDSNIYKYGLVDDIVNTTGYLSVIAKYKYRFLIYTDKTTTTTVEVAPIVGNRMLEQFVATVDQNQPLNEFEYYGLDTNELKNRWGETFIVETILKDPTVTNIRPTMTKYATQGKVPCGGFLIWKSRFGGWMYWGFDIQKKTYSSEYKGDLDVGMFEGASAYDGNPYVEVNYMEKSSSYSISLKALALTSGELLAVSGINASPAIYYQTPGTSKIELMRLSSASAPISSLANGGDFSVDLTNISSNSQQTR